MLNNEIEKKKAKQKKTSIKYEMRKKIKGWNWKRKQIQKLS
jgi:hypothetical protein